MKRIFKIIINCWENEPNRYLVWLPFLFALGIALYFALPTEPKMWLVLLISEIWLFLLFLFRNSVVRSIFIGGLVIICGFINVYVHTIYVSHHVEFQPQKTDYLSGKIVDISYSDKSHQRLLIDNVKDFNAPLKGRFRVTVTNLQEHFEVGQCVELVATVFPPSRMPIMAGFQLDRKYFFEKISGIGYANSEIFTIKCTEQSWAMSLKSAINKLRQDISEQVAEILPTEQSGVASALFIGEKSRISPHIINNYRGSGLAHFLSVSGLHLGTIAVLVFFFIRLILALIPFVALQFDIKKPAAITAIIFSAAYLSISGMAVPAQRAFIMTAVVFVGIIFNRQAISMRMVSLAALIILILQPQALISVSFQMSFAAVYALVAFYEHYASKINHLARRGGIFNKIFWYLSGIVVGDFVASLATMPFSTYHFHQIALYTSLGNLLAGPLIGLWLMPNVLVCLVALPLGLLRYPLLMLGYGIELLNKITDYVAGLPHSLLAVHSLSFGGFIAIVIGGYWLCVCSQKWRFWGVMPIIFGVASMFFYQSPDMIISPNGKAIAIRNQEKQMVLISPHADNWLKRIWRENFSIIENTKMLDDVLQCKNDECTYQKRIRFNNNGDFELNGKKQNICAGGYFYLQKNPYFEPLWNCSNKRLWNPVSEISD